MNKLRETVFGREPGGLRKRAAVGALWTVGMTFSQQALRLVSNLILTRLLVPEAFGLMTIVNSFLVGLTMLSDVGTKQSMIRSPRSDESFVHTAFTVQFVRGLALGALTLLAAYPMALFFEQPQLGPLLALTAVVPVLRGLEPTKLYISERKLDFGRVTVILLVVQVVSLIVMAVLAWWTRSVWALAIGSVIGAALGVVFRNVFIPGKLDRFRWEKEAVEELSSFGRWILLGSAAAYFCGEGLAFVQAKLVSLEVLGILAVARNLASLIAKVSRQVESRVLFPVYSRIQDAQPAEFRRQVGRARATILALTTPAFIVLMLIGPWLVNVLYDDRYAEAGEYLQLFVVGNALGSVVGQYGGALLARGHSRLATMLSSLEAVLRLGFYLAGITGLLLGAAAAVLCTYPLIAHVARRQKTLHLGLDLSAMAAPLLALALILFFQ